MEIQTVQFNVMMCWLIFKFTTAIFLDIKSIYEYLLIMMNIMLDVICMGTACCDEHEASGKNQYDEINIGFHRESNQRLLSISKLTP